MRLRSSFVCLFVLAGACGGPRIVLGGDDRSLTAAARPTQPPATVAQELDHGAPLAPPAPAPAAAPAPHVYVCPMHPEVTSADPSTRCPKCGMKLEVKP